jgi:hypothetical protein
MSYYLVDEVEVFADQLELMLVIEVVKVFDYPVHLIFELVL